MSVNFVRPRVSDLVFHLYGRPLHPELFDILEVHRVRKPDFDIVVRITRTGHVISWENRDVHLTEVTGVGDDLLPLRRRLLAHRFHGEQSASLLCAHGVCYQATFQVETLPPEIFQHVQDEIAADGGKRGILHHFPGHHRLALAPLSHLSVETKAGCLFLSTFHTFPDESTVIKTQSLIEFNPGRV